MSLFDKNLILNRNPWLNELVIMKETPSTQINAKTGRENSLYLTKRQSATYGRFGRKYFASESGGIYMSANLGPYDFNQAKNYTLLAAAAVVLAIEKLTTKQPQIKWVNDIYLDGKKIAGILAESSPSGIVLGMGINFSISDFPDELAGRAGSLFSTKEVPNISKSDLIAEIWAEFKQLEKLDYLETYKAHCFILGKVVNFKQNGIDFRGLASDLTLQGELVVDCDDGHQRFLNSGEISLEKWTDC